MKTWIVEHIYEGAGFQQLSQARIPATTANAALNKYEKQTKGNPGVLITPSCRVWQEDKRFTTTVTVSDLKARKTIRDVKRRAKQRR